MFTLYILYVYIMYTLCIYIIYTLYIYIIYTLCIPYIYLIHPICRYGKRIPIDEFRTQRRGGKGITSIIL